LARMEQSGEGTPNFHTKHLVEADDDGKDDVSAGTRLPTPAGGADELHPRNSSQETHDELEERDVEPADDSGRRPVPLGHV